jgi:hypothetical protein
MRKNALVGVLVVLALASFGYRTYVLDYAPEDVKRLCAHEPVNFGSRYQYSSCLARNWRR